MQLLSKHGMEQIGIQRAKLLFLQQMENVVINVIQDMKGQIVTLCKDHKSVEIFLQHIQNGLILHLHKHTAIISGSL